MVKLKDFLQYLYTVLLTVVMACVCLYTVHIWPFGNSYFTYIDNTQLVAAGISSINQVLNGTECWNWSYLAGGCSRTAFLATFHMLFCPTSWLAYAMPADNCMQTLSWLFLIQIACSSAAALFYLMRTFPHCPDALKLALALSYTFSDFLFTKFTYLPFLNFSALFPLFLYALDLLLKRGKYWPYLLISTYMLAVAPYFFWMWGVFAVIYIGSQMKLGWVLYKHAEVKIHILVFAGATLLAMGLSAFSWFPSYILTSESARAELVTKRQFFMTENGPSLLKCWMLTPLLFSALAVSKTCRNHLFRSHYGLALISLSVCCGCTTMNWLMHMGPPTGFPTRFSYMLSLMACCLVAHSGIGRIRLSPATIFIFLLACITLYITCCSGCAKLGWLAAFMLCSVLFYKKHFKAVLVALCAILCTVFVDSYHAEEWTNFERAPERLAKAEHLKSLLDPLRTSPWSRMRSVDLCLNSNFSQVSGINSFCNYFHSSSSFQQKTVNQLGYLPYFTRITDMGGTVFSDSFMGCEFLAAQRPMEGALITPIMEQEGLFVYRNPYYWGDGVMLSAESYNQAEEWGDDQIGNQQKLYNELGGEGELFEVRTASLEWDAQRQMFAVYQTYGREWLYLTSQSFPVSCMYFCKGWYANRCADAWRGKSKLGVIVSLATSDCLADMRVLQLKMSQASGEGQSASVPADSQVKLYHLQADRLATLGERLRGKVQVSAIRGRTMEVDINPNAAERVLLLPYVYHKGYSATDENGNKLQVGPHHGFTAIHLAKGGKQRISLHYELPYEKASLLLSAAYLLLLPMPTLVRRLPVSMVMTKWKRCFGLLISLGVVLGTWVVLSSPIWSELVRILFGWH